MMKSPEWYRERAAECERLADKFSKMSHDAGENAPGSFVTGSSGRTKAQDRKTEHALDRTIEYSKKAIFYLKKAERYLLQAKWIEEAPAREAQRITEAEEIKRKKKALKDLTDAEALFCGVYPTGLFFSDRRVMVNGDYKKLGHIFFDDLTFEIKEGMSEEMKALILAKINSMIARKGEAYEVSACGQTVVLGGG